jgi:hypothetical protein
VLGEKIGAAPGIAPERERRTTPETTMPKYFAPALLAALVATGALASDADTLVAQARTQSLPGAPELTPRLQQAPQGGSGSYVVSAAANEHASFLWVVDSVQHAVMLCEKADSKDFACTKKPLP